MINRIKILLLLLLVAGIFSACGVYKAPAYPDGKSLREFPQ
ncbi:MAG: hypothetical protein ACR2NY_03395 [Alphaproteobacteria bacterium]